MSFSRFLKVEISRVKPDEEKTRKKKKSRKNSDRHGDDDEDEDNGDENDYEYLFVCNCWLAKNEDDGEIVRELVPGTKSGLKRRNTLSGKCSVFSLCINLKWTISILYRVYKMEFDQNSTNFPTTQNLKEILAVQFSCASHF